MQTQKVTVSTTIPLHTLEGELYGKATLTVSHGMDLPTVLAVFDMGSMGLAGVRLTAADARALARVLTEAASDIDGAGNG